MTEKTMRTKRLTAFLLCLLLALALTGFLSGPSVPEADTSQAYAAITSSDFLKTDGTLIRNNSGSGDVVYLRGTNAGGWLVQESWMCPTNAPDQKTAISTFDSRFGVSSRNALFDAYYDNYWTESDFDKCAAMGMTCIRLPFTYMNLVTDDWSDIRADGWEYLDWFVENCASRGMYVILDLHGAFGSQNGMDHSGEVNDGYQLYWNNDYRGKTKWLWWQIANRYKNEPAVAGYDILNEPGIKAANTYSLQWDFYDEIYDTIRGVDSNHIIIMESCWMPNNLPAPSTYGWTNVMYEYHWYPWDYVSDANGQINSANYLLSQVNSANYGVPTFIGEFTCFGESSAWSSVLSMFKTNGWHWTNWSYKATGSSTSWGIYNWTPGTVNIYSDSYNTILQKWTSMGTASTHSHSTVYNAIKNSLSSGNRYTLTDLAAGDYYLTSANGDKVVTAPNAGGDPLAATKSSYGGDSEKLTLIKNADGTVSLKSGANGKYVCAVIDQSSQLLARSATIGTWEKFRIFASGGTYGLLSVANNKFVRADFNNGGVLKATSATINGAWEAFKITPASGSALLAGGDYYLASTNGNKVVCAENYGNDPLAATRDAYGGDWEKLTLVNNADGTVSLKSGANGKYVCAVIDQSSQLLARSTAIDAWEKFELFAAGENTYGLRAVANGKYVRADFNNGGVLKATSDSIAGAWEAFRIIAVT